MSRPALTAAQEAALRKEIGYTAELERDTCHGCAYCQGDRRAVRRYCDKHGILVGRGAVCEDWTRRVPA